MTERVRALSPWETAIVNAVRCPKCGMPSGNRCRTRKGGYTRTLHWARVDDFRECVIHQRTVYSGAWVENSRVDDETLRHYASFTVSRQATLMSTADVIAMASELLWFRRKGMSL